MTKVRLSLLAVLLVIGVVQLQTVSTETGMASRPVATAEAAPRLLPTFTPRVGNFRTCKEVVLEQLAAARTSIYLQGYGFTDPDIAAALIGRAAAGVEIELVLDDSNEDSNTSQAGRVAAAGVKVFIDDDHAIAHNKIIVIDGVTVLTGSFNWTQSAAKRNAENLLVVHHRRTAAAYLANWQHHRSHSRPLKTGN